MFLWTDWEMCQEELYLKIFYFVFPSQGQEERNIVLFGYKIIMNIYLAHFFSLRNYMWIGLENVSFSHIILFGTQVVNVCVCVCVCVFVYVFACAVITYLAKHGLSPKIKCTYFELEAARHNF